MDAEVQEVSGATVVRPSDDLDLLGYQALAERVESILHAGQKRIVIDLSSVSYINSPAVSALMRLRERTRKAGGLFAVASVKSGARLALEAIGAIRVLSVHDSVEGAVSSMGASR